MVMRRLLVGMAFLVAVVAGPALRPRPAAASDNLQYIIPAALSGAVVIVLVVAILISEHKAEPELDLIDRWQPPAEPAHGIRFAPACRPTANGLPLLCW